MTSRHDATRNKRPSNQQFNFVTIEHPSATRDPTVRHQVRSHVTSLQHRLNRQRRSALRAALFAEHEQLGRRQQIHSAQDSAPQEPAALPSKRREDTYQQEFSRVDDPTSPDATTKANDKKPGRQYRRGRILQEALTPQELVDALPLASKTARVSVLNDPTDRLARIFGRLSLDFSSVMAHYHWIVGAQCPDFERQFMTDRPARYGFETMISGIPMDPALVATAALISTGHILSIRNAPMSQLVASCIFELRSYVMHCINLALQEPRRATSDSLLVAVLILATHEGLQGSTESYHIHMRGLVQMINLRGGMKALNDSKTYIDRLIIWQDTNVSTIMRCSPYHKKAKDSEGCPVAKPNPMMWLLKDV